MQKRVFYPLLIIIIAVGLLSCKTKSGGSGSFQISGRLTNHQAKIIYLEEVPIDVMIPLVVDSAIISDNGAYILDAAPTQSTVYNLRLDNNRIPLATVINDTEKMTLDATLSTVSNQATEDYILSGSPASQELKQFLIKLNSDLQRIFAIETEGRQIDKQQEIAMELNGYVKEALVKSKNPAQSLIMLANYQTTANNPQSGLKPFSIDEVAGIVDGLSAQYPHHTSVSNIQKNLIETKQRIAEAEKMKGVGAKWIGKTAPEIMMPDVNGNTIKLSSLKGKYVLVDFWASWCGPCRQENPNLVAAYSKYKTKKFEILGVSLDDNKQRWQAAIQKDKLHWPNISDLQGWQSAAIGLYEFSGIPYNVLIDPQGKIIAENLRGSALAETLSQVLK